MDKLILVDKTEIEVENGASVGYMTTKVNDFKEVQTLFDKLTKENLKNIFISSDGIIVGSYSDMILTSPNLKITEKPNYLEVIFGMRKCTRAEIEHENIMLAVTYLNDAQALTVKTLYPLWEDDTEGYFYSLDKQSDLRRLYNGRLWKLKSIHNKQSEWYPGSNPTLWEEIVEGYDGTREHPIPIPDSVAVSGFEYEYGKYYIENDTIYLAEREGKKHGDKETLFFPPSSLVGQNFIIVM